MNKFLKNKIYSSYSAENILEIYEILNNMLIDNEFDEYSKLLKNLNIYKIKNIILVIGLLRLSFLFKKDIPYWKTFLNETKIYLKYKNEDYENILKGLINE